MSIIKCPECGNDISNKASSCPKCGYPITKEKNSTKLGNNYTVIKFLNICLTVFGFLMTVSVLKSNGGIAGNRNAAIISYGLIIGGILFLITFRNRSKLLLVIASLFYMISVVICLKSLSIRISYLILEAIIGLACVLNIAYAKRERIF